MAVDEPREGVQQASHWGTYRVATDGRDITAVTPWKGDRDPSPLLGNLPGSVTHRARVRGPAVRRGWLEDGPGPAYERGRRDDPKAGYVAISWQRLEELLAAELRRVIDTHGNQAIFGGSYGWGSAGRFHHAQSQVHRFLNALGGYTRSVNSYSTGALEVLLPRIAIPEQEASQRATPWADIVGHTELWVAFGGVPVKNTGTNHGGVGDHPTGPSLAAYLDRAAAPGPGRLVGVTPLRDDLPEGAGRDVTWLAPRPGTDTALLLALAHTLISEDLVDTGFVATHTSGYDDLAAYLLGRTDGTTKDGDWAAALCQIPAQAIRDLARNMATHRTLVTMTWSLQRAQHGEMAIWALVALAALLGQVGLPGGGFGFGYGSMNEPGLSRIDFRLPTLPQGRNGVDIGVPVAALSDLLLRPGETIDYDGGHVTFPDIRLVYWAGGNPFHHAQDLGRLRTALQRPDTIVVHDPYWTPMARHADIVVPSTTAAERDDLTGSANAALLVAMAAAVPRYADARDDYDTFAALAARLGVGEAFTQGRTSAEWVRFLYEEWRADLASGAIVPRGPGGEARRIEVPSYDDFRRLGVLELPTPPTKPLLADFRGDPIKHRLATPSGRIELASPTIAEMHLPDCPGHPAWLPPEEWAGADRYPLALIANQPRTRLHSQLDGGAASQASKVDGREPLRMHPDDAATRGISAGQIVRVHNDRGGCLAGAILDDGLRQGVVQLSTGAWYDPQDSLRSDVHAGDGPALDVHGNPNVLTSDRRTSCLAQASTGQHAQVEVEAWWGPLPPIRAYDPPL